MNEDQLKIFIDCVKNYFSQFNANDEVEFGTPFVNSPERIKEVILDYTGTIAISGDYVGALYISTGRPLLDALAKKILGTQEVSESDVVDIAGELANTIAGNVRKSLGKGFEISVPMIISGKFSSMEIPRLKSPTYVVPFKWMNCQSYICIGLDRVAG